MRPSFLSILLLGASLAGVSASSFTNTLGDGDFADPANWENGQFPEDPERAEVNTTGVNRAVLNSYVETHPRALRVGVGGSGELEIQQNGFLQITSVSGDLLVGHDNGDIGIIEQNGGTVCVGASVSVGTSGGDGAYVLNAGMLKSSRGSFEVGGGGGSGIFEMSGGALHTRTGVTLGRDGEFIVKTSNPHWIELGSLSSIDGYWDQESGSKVTFLLDQSGVTPIEVKYVDGDGRGGEVVFENGSEIEVAFADGMTPVNGTWTVMEWDGALTNDGLSFSPEVDTSIWSFAIVGNTLQVTASNASLSNSTTAGTPHDWYQSFFNGLNTAADYEALENVDSDGDGLVNRDEFLKKTDPTDGGLVSSLEDLMKYASCDGVTIEMAPGEYVVTRDDLLNYRFPIFPDRYGTFPFLRFTGNDSSYDLAGVTIKISAYKYAYCGFQGGEQPLTGIHVIGDDNIIRGLVWEENDDNYSELMFRSAVSIIVDGDGTLFDSFKFTTAGSFPYGYGSYFGIGADNTIAHDKHSGMLLRGDDTHLFKVTYYARTFGQGLFIQGSKNTILEECYVEGQLRTTDDMLTDTSGPAFDIGFVTRNDDEVLEPGHMASLQEDGIRAYASGFDYETGGSRSTDNVTVINCTVKNMRRGVHLNFTPGGNLVRGTTVIGNQELGFIPADNDRLIDCYGDATFAPVLYMYYSGISGVEADITVIEREESDFYGNDVIAYVAGSNNEITIRDLNQCGGDAFGRILVSGESGAYFLPGKTNISSSSNTLTNESRYPIFVGDRSNNADIFTSTVVTDEGSRTDVSSIPYVVAPYCSTTYDAYSLIQAEDFAEISGGQLLSNGAGVTGLGERDWVKFPHVNFGSFSPEAFEILLGKTTDSGGFVEARLDSPTGEVIARIAAQPTGGSQSWQPFVAPLSGTDITGERTVFITFDHTTGGSVANVDAFRFLGRRYDFSTTKSNTAPMVSNSDLAQTHYLSSSLTGGGDNSEHASLFNGLVGNGDGDADDIGEVRLNDTSTVTVTFDTSENAGGFDVTGITTCFGWNPAGGGRSNQGYEILVTYVDGTVESIAGPQHWEPNEDPSAFWTTVSFVPSEQGFLASGVKSVTFDITDNGNAGATLVAREFDIFGTPTNSALDEWRFANFGTYENSGIAADDYDADSDGLANLVEYATGLNPNDGSELTAFEMRDSLERPGEMEIAFDTIDDPSISYQLQGSNTLEPDDWDTVISTTGLGDDTVVVPKAAWPALDSYFFRLLISN
ncbi:carbohydrate-binding protein [Verrucomicrobiales bacterium]|nr:carbohydrate-binding protein [Verrucomicrobiales bacterium]